MSKPIHIPALRFGQPYKSCDVLSTNGAEISQVKATRSHSDVAFVGHL
jgi:hypothetical protein